MKILEKSLVSLLLLGSFGMGVVYAAVDDIESTDTTTIETTTSTEVIEETAQTESRKERFLVEPLAEDDYLTQRGLELSETYQEKSEFPSIEKELPGVIGKKMTQTISFSPMNEETGELLSVDEVLGDGTTPNPKSLSVNIFTHIPYDESQLKTLYSTGFKKSGLSLILDGEAATKPLYFIRDKIKFYEAITEDGKKEIKILSGASLNPTGTNVDYVIELTASSSANESGIDFSVKMTNTTGEKQKFRLVYTAYLESKDAITGEDKTREIQKSIGKKGYYLNNGYRDNYSKIVTELTFPERNEDGEIEGEKVDSDTLSKPGETRSLLVDDPIEEPQPEPDEPEPPVEDSFINLKSSLQEKEANESLTLNWRIATEERGLEILPNEDYREMDRRSGIDLDDYVKSNVIPPLKVDSSAYDGLSNQENYVIFGKADAIDDSLSALKSGKPTSTKSTRNTNVNFPYEQENQTKKKTGLGLIFPRIITYNKDGSHIGNSKKFNLHSYSFDYLSGLSGSGNGDFLVAKGDPNISMVSGFGLATFKNEKVDVPTPIPGNAPNNGGENRNNFVEEAFISEDGKTVLVYGQYQLGGTNIPMRATVKSVGTGGKVQVTYEYLNKMSQDSNLSKINFGAYFGIYFDINGRTNTGLKPRASTVRTLGDMDGIYFRETLDKDEKPIDPYYVGFYTTVPSDAIAPSNILVQDRNDDYGTGTEYQSFQNNPLNWRNSGKDRNEFLPEFDRSQEKGEAITRRDVRTGKIKPEAVSGPLVTFVYDDQSLAFNDMGRADFEMRVSDIDVVEYSPVTISSEEITWNNQDEAVYNPVFKQKLDASTAEPRYMPDSLTVKTTFGPYVNGKIEDFKVYGNDSNQEIDSSLYSMTIDEDSYSMILEIPNTASLHSSFDYLTIKQQSTIKTDVEKIGQFYNKEKQQFNLPVVASNSWTIKKEGQVEPVGPFDNGQDVKGSQTVKYQPTIQAEPKPNMSVGLNANPGEAIKYVDVTYQPDFSFDEPVARFSNDTPPVFDTIGNKNVEVVVGSKYFGHPQTIQVPVTVTNDVKMTVKHVLINPKGEGEAIRDLTDSELGEVLDIEASVKPTDTLDELLKSHEEKVYDGYTFKKRIIKIGNEEVTDTTTLPTSDFIAELQYEGSVKLNHPTGFNFGNHKLNLSGYEEVRPEITHDNETLDLGNNIQIINTQGLGSVWKLSVKQTQPMMNATSTLKGKIYYIPQIGSEEIVIDDTSKPIAVNSEEYQIINKVSLLPEQEQKTGMFMDVYSGNKKGVYSGGEITWNLENAL